MLVSSGLALELEELVRKSNSGIDEKGDSKNPVIKISQNNISNDRAQTLANFMKEESLA